MYLDAVNRLVCKSGRHKSASEQARHALVGLTLGSSKHVVSVAIFEDLSQTGCDLREAEH